MTGRGRGRGRGRGTPLFINKDMKDLLSSQAVGRADEVPPPLYDVSVTKFVFIFFMANICAVRGLPKP